ncbi:MAG TPA: hypothetical protein VGC18_14955, partial [Lacisediminihabitans sp.]|uniref:hypothetical protein n=1 Tax=Lacisediminihabitans sp. TaxID=2787631 RepID=UPI002EDA40C5
TLYRYFPSKDLILLDPFTKVDAVAGALRGRPADEPIELALGAAIRQALEAVVAEQPHLDTVRTIIDGAPGPRARLWDFIAQDRDLLEKAIAARVGGGLSDLRIKMTARLTLLVIDLAADTWRSGDHRRSMTDIADGILDEIGGEGIVVPRRPRSR